MATLQELQPGIDAGMIAERNGKSSEGFSMKNLVYRENETYVWVEFVTYGEDERPGCKGFDDFQEIINADCTYTKDGMHHWFPIKKEVPHQPGSSMGKFFYLWLTNWCKEWRKGKAD